MIIEHGLPEARVKETDDFISTDPVKPRTRSITIGSVVAIVSSCIAVTGATYTGGRYAARQCEVRLGLTKSLYRANRWGFRATLSGLIFAGGTTGASVALGFDNYFMEV